MLNLWYGDGFEGEYLSYPDGHFELLYEDDWFETDFSRRVLRECSGGVEVIDSRNFKCVTGVYISHKELSSGAKALLLLRYTDYPCTYLYCGENCDPFIGDILEAKDEITLIVLQFYVPDNDICSKYGVKLLNTGEMFYSRLDLVSALIENNLF